MACIHGKYYNILISVADHMMGIAGAGIFNVNIEFHAMSVVSNVGISRESPIPGNAACVGY